MFGVNDESTKLPKIREIQAWHFIILEKTTTTFSTFDKNFDQCLKKVSFCVCILMDTYNHCLLLICPVQCNIIYSAGKGSQPHTYVQMSLYEGNNLLNCHILYSTLWHVTRKKWHDPRGESNSLDLWEILISLGRCFYLGTHATQSNGVTSLSQWISFSPSTVQSCRRIVIASHPAVEEAITDNMEKPSGFCAISQSLPYKKNVQDELVWFVSCDENGDTDYAGHNASHGLSY